MILETFSKVKNAKSCTEETTLQVQAYAVFVNEWNICSTHSLSIPDRSAVEVQYILHIHFSDSAVYTTGTLQLVLQFPCIAGVGSVVEVGTDIRHG